MINDVPRVARLNASERLTLRRWLAMRAELASRD
jgi:hypothetical protein